MVHDLAGQAWSAMRHNRRRTALTMLGMAWGIATVVLLLAYGAGFGRAIGNIFSQMGMQMMGFFPGRTSLQAGGAKAGVQVRLTMDDVQHIQELVPLVGHISAESSLDSASVQNDNRTFNFPVNGFQSPIQYIRAIDMESGRFFNPEDEVQRARVAVLGSEAKTKLFSGQYAVGEKIRINGVTFDVIGVTGPKMQEGDDNINRVVYIPLSAMADLRDTRYLSGIWINYEGNQYEKIEANVRSVLGGFHNFDAKDPRAVFCWNSMRQLDNWRIFTIALEFLLSLIGMATLGVGGVGLMNIMLVSVTQRTREIGIRKAVGAFRRDIIGQFLTEAETLSSLGGVIGVLIGIGLAALVRALPISLPAAVPMWSVLVGLIVSMTVGIFFGAYPAVKASRLDPIESLRYE
jgi:putative ABC transport system permease protein